MSTYESANRTRNVYRPVDSLFQMKEMWKWKREGNHFSVFQKKKEKEKRNLEKN